MQASPLPMHVHDNTGRGAMHQPFSFVTSGALSIVCNALDPSKPCIHLDKTRRTQRRVHVHDLGNVGVMPPKQEPPSG